jgi:hypothetical protein
MCFSRTSIFRGFSRRQSIAKISVREKPREGCIAKFECREKLLFYSKWQVQKYSNWYGFLENIAFHGWCVWEWSLEIYMYAMLFSYESGRRLFPDSNLTYDVIALG